MLTANMVWPSLILAGRLLTWWIIGAGLLIELCFVLWITRSSFAKASLMTLVMNGISALVGMVDIPLSGIIWESVAAATILPLSTWGTFNRVTWLGICYLAAFLNTAIETGALRWIFKVNWTRMLFWWLFLANLITVGMAMISLINHPPKPL